jgi:O-antigen/teichoic acid export membrane protein
MGASQSGRAPAAGEVTSTTRRVAPRGRDAWILIAGSFGSYGLSFIRNLILARVLTKADFGTAALLGNTLLMFEIASRMSFGQQIVQSPSGGSREFRDSAHLCQLVIGVAGVVLMLFVAFATRNLSSQSALSWAVVALALVPAVRAFENLDVFREQRRFNQWPAMVCELAPQLIVTLLAWPLAVWLRDFRAVLLILVAKPLLSVLTSHVLAFERYGLSWRPEHMRAMAAFGGPLVLNGALVFISQQADQFVVATALPSDELAAYALTFAAVSVPWALFAQPSSSFMLPLLSAVQDQPGEFREQYAKCLALASVAAATLTLPLIVFGEQLITLAYGTKYAGTGPLMALMATTAAIRFLRITPAIAAMARADTRNHLISSVVRAMSLPVAVLLAANGSSTLEIATAGLIAEIAATAVSLGRLTRHGVSPRDSRKSILFVVATLALGGAMSLLGASQWRPAFAALGMVALPMLVIVISRSLFPPLARVLVLPVRHA